MRIRIDFISPNASGTGFCEGLRSVALVEVKWCSELPGAKVLPYGVGVRYFEPTY